MDLGEAIRENFIKPMTEADREPGENEERGEDGLIYCTLCGAAKQSNIPPFGIVRSACQCVENARRAEEERKHREQIEQRRRLVFGRKVKRLSYTFENDDGGDPEASKKAREYCDNFEEYRKSGQGLTLCSPTTGNGKTFLACCIVNELISRGYRVKVTEFVTLKDELTRCDKGEYMDRLCSYDLVMIDDLGAENVTGYTNETECYIIDNLTESGVPLIVTTNYTAAELTGTKDIGRRRIFDRINNVCPVVQLRRDQSRRLERCRQITADLNKKVKEG